MKLTLKSGGIAIFFSVIIFISGVFWVPLLVTYLIPFEPGITVLSRDMKAQFSVFSSLGIVLAFIPVSVLAVWNLASINSFKKRILSILIVCISVSCFLLLRRQLLQSGTRTTIYTEDLHFATYAAFGLLAGGALAYLLLRMRKRPITA